jgi:Domain of unknown function (DUF4149)
MYFTFVPRFLFVISAVLCVANSWQLQPPAINGMANPAFNKANPLPWNSMIVLRPRSTMTNAVATGDGSAKKEAWTEPRIHNTRAFRSFALLGALAAAGLSSNSPITNVLSAQSLAALHMFSYATWFGTMVYTTFILGITMFKNLPRKTFGTLQAKIFPKYFALSSISIVLQVSHVVSPVLSHSLLSINLLLLFGPFLVAVT